MLFKESTKKRLFGMLSFGFLGALFMLGNYDSWGQYFYQLLGGFFLIAVIFLFIEYNERNS